MASKLVVVIVKLEADGNALVFIVNSEDFFAILVVGHIVVTSEVVIVPDTSIETNGVVERGDVLAILVVAIIVVASEVVPVI